MTGIDLKVTDAGLLLPVRAQPGARRNQLGGVHDGCLKVAVTQVAEGGKANKEIHRLLAAELNIPRSRIQLIVGATSTRKVFLITGVTLDELLTRLEEWLK